MDVGVEVNIYPINETRIGVDRRSSFSFWLVWVLKASRVNCAL